MKRTSPFIIPLTMLLVGIALDSFAGSATLYKPRKATIARKELADKPHLEQLRMELLGARVAKLGVQINF